MKLIKSQTINNKKCSYDIIHVNKVQLFQWSDQQLLSYRPKLMMPFKPFFSQSHNQPNSMLGRNRLRRSGGGRGVSQQYNTGVREAAITPVLSDSKSVSIYVRREPNLPLFMDFMLRFSWILNIACLSGFVLIFLTSLRVSGPTNQPD